MTIHREVVCPKCGAGLGQVQVIKVTKNKITDVMLSPWSRYGVRDIEDISHEEIKQKEEYLISQCLCHNTHSIPD